MKVRCRQSSIHTPSTVKKQRVLWTREEKGVDYKLVIDTWSHEGAPYLRVGGVGMLPMSVYTFPWEPEYQAPVYGEREVDVPDHFLDEIQKIVEETWPSKIRLGQVKKWSRDHRYGFLSQERGPDVYFRFSSLRGEVRSLANADQLTGVTVTFKVTATPKGWEARSVEQKKEKKRNG